MQQYQLQQMESGNDNNTILIISNDEMKDIAEIVESLKDSGLILEKVSATIQSEAKEQRGGFISMLLGMLVQVYQKIFQQEEGQNRTKRK